MPLSLCAILVAATLGAGATPAVVHLTASDVAAKTSGGNPLILQADGYKIMLSERVKTGEAELHATDTDIFHVVIGKAVLVTGGTVVESRETAAGETRGPSIQGGEERALAPGDVVVIPKGVPHWFKSVEGRFQYFVVKVPG